MVEEGRGRRNAIRLHETYTVETVVVADSDMVQYHGAEAAQRFLLTVMNMVRIMNTVSEITFLTHPQYLYFVFRISTMSNSLSSHSFKDRVK